MGNNLQPRRIAGSLIAAMDFTGREPKDQTLQRVTKRLTGEYNFPLEAAQDAAAAAIADHESKHIDGIFDLQSSTDSCLFLQIGGVRRAVTLADIVEHLEFQ